MYVIGLMSGTSADGIDAALIELDGELHDLRRRFVAHEHHDYPRATREAILSACTPASGGVDSICRLNFELGERLALAARAVAEQGGMPVEQVQLIGSHGQTIWHDVDADGRVTSTLQIGEAAVIAERTGVPTIADFRVADVAAGGQGAPLVPFVDYILFHDATKYRAAQNIGGIANVSLLPAGGGPEDVIAFDSGPGNMVIDALVERMSGGTNSFDRDGRIAASGRVNDEWLARLLEHPYFGRPAPKTTGRELFGRAYAEQLWREGLARGLKPEDIVATATALSAETIALALAAGRDGNGPLPDELILGGGGAHNPTLVGMIAARLPQVAMRRPEDFGVPAQGKEALAFAILAYAAYHGQTNNLPSATGARHPVVMGKISHPR